MPAWLADLPVSNVASPETLTSLCPSCHARVPSDAVLCTSCGTNVLTGQQVKAARPKKEKPAKQKRAMDPVGVGDDASESGRRGFWVLLGTSAAAGIAVTIAWILIASSVGSPIPFVAGLVGVACGGMAYIVSSGSLGFAPLAAALIATVTSVSIGNGATGYLGDRDEIGDEIDLVELIPDEFALQMLVDDIAEARMDAGLHIRWPDPGMTLEEAIWPDDYPKELQEETLRRWNAMTEEEQLAYRADCARRVAEWEEELRAEEENRQRTRAGGVLVRRSIGAARMSGVGVRSGRGGRARGGAVAGMLIGYAVVASANGGGPKLGICRAHEYFFALVAIGAAIFLSNRSRD